MRQRLERERQQGLQPPDARATEGAGCPGNARVAGQLAQDLSKRQVRIAKAGVRIAVSPRHNQIGLRYLGLPGEFLHQGGLAAAGLPDDEGRKTPTGQRQVQVAIQLRQFLFLGNEDRRPGFHR